MSAAGGPVLRLETLVVHITGDASALDRTLAGSMSNVERWASNTANAVSATYAAIVAASLKQFADFDAALTRSLMLSEMLTDNARQHIRNAMMDIASGSISTPTDLAKSFGILSQSGRSLAESTKELANIQKFAAVGQMELEEVTRRLIDAQMGLGMHTTDTNKDIENQMRIMDVLTKSMTLADVTLQELLSAFRGRSGLGSGTVGTAVFRSAGMDIEQVAAAMVVLARQGIKGQEVGTLLTRTLLTLQRSAAANAAEWRAMGVSVFDATGKMLPLDAILKQLQSRFANVSMMEKQMILNFLGGAGGGAISGALQALLEFPDAMKDVENTLRGASGTMNEMANITLNTFNNQLKITYNNFRILLITIGSYLAPTLKIINDHVREAIQWWNGLNPAIQSVIINLMSAYTALRLIMFVMSRMGVVAGILSFAFSWVGILIAAVAGVTAAIVHFTVGFDAAGEKIKEGFMTAVGFLYNIKDNLPILLEWVKDQWANMLTDMVEILKTFTMNSAQILWAFIKGGASPIFEWFGGQWQNILQDMITLTITFAKNGVDNIIVMTETMIRLMAVFAGWLSKNLPIAMSMAVVAMFGLFAAMISKMFDLSLKMAPLIAKALLGGKDAAKEVAQAITDAILTLTGKLPADFKRGIRTDNIVQELKDTWEEQQGKFVPMSKGMKWTTTINPAEMWQSIKESISNELKGTPNLLEGFVSAITKFPKFVLDTPDMKKLGALLDKVVPSAAPSMPLPELSQIAAPPGKGQFKVMSLNRFVLSGMEGSNPNLDKPVEVRSPGMERKLEEIRAATANLAHPLIGW